MKNALILAAVAAAILGIIGVKLANKSDETPSCCPCTMAKESVTNQVDEGSSTVE